MMGRSAGPPSPSRLSPHISYSVYEPQAQAPSTGSTGSTGSTDDLDQLDFPALDLGASAAPAMDSAGSGGRTTSFDQQPPKASSTSSSSAGAISFFVEMAPVTGKWQFETVNGETIRDCKQKLHEKEGIPVHVQQWFANGCELENDKFFSTSPPNGYGFGKGTTIHLVMVVPFPKPYGNAVYPKCGGGGGGGGH